MIIEGLNISLNKVRRISESDINKVKNKKLYYKEISVCVSKDYGGEKVITLALSSENKEDLELELRKDNPEKSDRIRVRQLLGLTNHATDSEVNETALRWLKTRPKLKKATKD